MKIIPEFHWFISRTRDTSGGFGGGNAGIRSGKASSSQREEEAQRGWVEWRVEGLRRYCYDPVWQVLLFFFGTVSSQQQDSDMREHCPVQKPAFCDLHFDPMFGSEEEKRRKAKLANAFAFGNEDDDKREQERIAAAKQAVPDSASNNFNSVASKMTTTLLSHLWLGIRPHCKCERFW